LEVSKTLRGNGTYGPSYQEAANRSTADYLTGAEKDHAQRSLANEETVASAVAPALAGAERAQAIMRAWVAADAASVRLIHEAQSIARTSSTVLIRGESGTGKDLLAWILHALSPRAERPLVRVDCASLPSELLEAELFGNSDAALSFTNPTGRLEIAAGGTLVLDEVSALSLPAQAKLFRLIEDRRFDGDGNTRSVASETRIIALTTANLEQLVARRSFREDLYYRLNVIPMVIPALHERPADVLPLTTTFLNRAAEVQRKPKMLLSPIALAALERYAFPGNVRELRQMITEIVQAATGTEVQITDLPSEVRESIAGARKMSLEDMERAYIGEVLEYTKGRKTMAAKILGISRKTLLEKRKRYGLD
jgi:two-component system response regulator AtoC